MRDAATRVGGEDIAGVLDPWGADVEGFVEGGEGGRGGDGEGNVLVAEGVDDYSYGAGASGGVFRGVHGGVHCETYWWWCCATIARRWTFVVKESEPEPSDRWVVL